MGMLSHAFFVLLVAISSWSWSTLGYSREFYPYPRAPARRSAHRSCAPTGDHCMGTRECCSESDVCLTSTDYSSGEKTRRSTCENMKRELKYARSIGRALKPSGTECTVSSECADGCCRRLTGHRTYYKICGTPTEDQRVYKCESKRRSFNDVLSDLL